MEYVIGAVWALLELVCFSLFCKAFLERKANVQKSLLLYAATFCVLFVFTNIVDISPFQQIVTIGTYVFLSFCLYRGHWLRHILVVILLFVFAAVVDTGILYGASILIGLSYDELVWKKLTYITIVTVGKLIEILIAYIAYYLRPAAGKQPIQGKWLGLLLLFPTASLSALFVIFNAYKAEADLPTGAFLLCIALGLTNIANIYLVRSLEQSARKDQEMSLLNQQMEIQTQSILELERQHKLQRQAAHEHQRQLQTIHDLITTDKVGTAQSYIEELRGNASTRLCVINSHHPVIDAVLNHKYQMAKDRSIEMQVQVNHLANIKLSADALVVLLSNLLDNAIEACEKVPEKRMIHCRILLGDTLFLSVRNTSLPVVISNGNIQTTKPNKKDHGFGLIGIRHILDRHQAEYTYQYQDGWFQFVAEIPCDN